MILCLPNNSVIHDKCQVDPNVVVTELVNLNMISFEKENNLVFLGCGDATCETQIWSIIAHMQNIIIGHVLFIDKCITSTTIANIQNTLSNNNFKTFPIICLSYTELYNKCKKLDIDSHTVIIGVHAAMITSSSHDVFDIYKFMIWCAENENVTPLFVNFFAGPYVGRDDRKHLDYTKDHWVYIQPWRDLANEFINCKASVQSLLSETDQC